MEYVKCPITHQQVLADQFEAYINRRFPDWKNTDLVQNVLKEIKASKIVDVKISTPKVDVPKVDVPKVDVPKVDVPKVDVPKVEIKKEISQIPKNNKNVDSDVNVKSLTKEELKNE